MGRDDLQSQLLKKLPQQLRVSSAYVSGSGYLHFPVALWSVVISPDLILDVGSVLGGMDQWYLIHGMQLHPLEIPFIDTENYLRSKRILIGSGDCEYIGGRWQ
jgi:hypothetical protein